MCLFSIFPQHFAGFSLSNYFTPIQRAKPETIKWDAGRAPGLNMSTHPFPKGAVQKSQVQANPDVERIT